MRPLNGSFYVNIFSHYRPVGDPQWYEKPNPPGTPEPLIDVGDCHRTDNGDASVVVCDKAYLPTLSPSLEVLRSPADLFNWWSAVSPKKEVPSRVDEVPDL